MSHPVSVIGKVLPGELSCMWTGLVVLPLTSKNKMHIFPCSSISSDVKRLSNFLI